MNTEIELKYLIINNNVVDGINELLEKQSLSFKQSHLSLANCYFDTANLKLRQLDMGLRVRVTNGAIEQTIKTSGTVVAGLHQRPEYNVTIMNKEPNLALFPAEIWANERDNDQFTGLERLQAELIPLFATDFERVIWLITNENGSQIELAFDLGCITVEGASESICELELELVSGETKDLFVLAQLLADNFLLRPGIKSKAARGYALFAKQKQALQKNPQELIHHDKKTPITPLELIPLKHGYSIERSFSVGLEFSLNQLQKMIDIYCAEPSLKVLIKITELLALIRHGFWLFQKYLPESVQIIRSDLSRLIKELSWVENATYFQELTDKTGNYRKKLAYSEQLISQLKVEKSRFPTAESVIEIFYSPRFNAIQLALLDLLLTLNNQHKGNSAQHDHDLYTFAQDKLEASLVLLMNNLMQHKKLTLTEYLSQQKLLIRSLLTGSWCGSLYGKSERLEFRDSWLDVKQGMDELHTLLTLQQQLTNISGEQFEKIHGWLDSKVDSLLLALDCSRKNAMSLTPYWR
jgi:triphosphatase